MSILSIFKRKDSKKPVVHYTNARLKNELLKLYPESDFDDKVNRHIKMCHSIREWYTSGKICDMQADHLKMLMHNIVVRQQEL